MKIESKQSLKKRKRGAQSKESPRRKRGIQSKERRGIEQANVQKEKKGDRAKPKKGSEQ